MKIDTSNGKAEMPEGERQRNIALLKKVLGCLESGDTDSVQYAIGVAFKEDGTDEGQGITCALWGQQGNLLRVISSLTEPLVKPLVEQMNVGDLRAAAAMSAAAQAKKQNLFALPSEADACDLPN